MHLAHRISGISEISDKGLRFLSWAWQAIIGHLGLSRIFQTKGWGFCTGRARPLPGYISRIPRGILSILGYPRISRIPYSSRSPVPYSLRNMTLRPGLVWIPRGILGFPGILEFRQNIVRVRPPRAINSLFGHLWPYPDYILPWKSWNSMTSWFQRWKSTKLLIFTLKLL